MKRTNLRKVLVSLLISIVMLLVLSIEEQAATRIMDQLVANANQDITKTLGEAGIYQTALNAYMDTDRTISSNIANSRTHYGKGETLKIRFSFSREISSYNGLELGIKFGDGIERKITNSQKIGSYLVFSYNIAATNEKEGTVGDNGGLQITYIKGTVTDTSGNTISLGIVGNENTWKNTIIAKGDWSVIYTDQDNQEAKKIQFAEPIYVLFNNTLISSINLSDITLLNSKTGEKKNPTAMILSDDGNGGVTSIEYTGTDGYDIIYVKNACDIAGNKRAVSNGYYKHAVYVVDSECVKGELENGKEVPVNEVDGVKYFKAGDKIVFLALASCTTKYPEELDHYFSIGTGGMKLDGFTREHIAHGIYKLTYIIQSGDNGEIAAICNALKTGGVYDETRRFDSSKYIADTTAPKVTFGGIYLESGKAYYSETNNAGNNTNGNMLETGETNKKTSGTIWAKKGTSFNLMFTVNETGGRYDFSMENNEAFKFGNSSQNGDKVDIYLDAKGEGICEGELTFKDYAGNETILKLKDKITLLCDDTAPIVNIKTPNSTATSSGSYSNNDIVEFTIEPTDPKIDNYIGSGVKRPIDEQKIMVANGTIMQKSSKGNITTVKVLPQGEGNVSLFVMDGATEDNVGNKSQASSITKVYSDRTAPVINDVTGVPTNWVDQATLSVVASDAGVGEIQYRFKQGNGNWTNYSTTNTYTVNANGMVYIQVKDKLGNESEVKTVNITKIDNENPVISGVDYHSGWTNQDVEVTINASDSQSGIAAYSFDNGSTWQESPKKTYTANTTIAANTLRVKDYAGKIAQYGQAISIQIDKTAPTIATSISPTNETSGTVTLSVTPSDVGGSGVYGISFNGGAYDQVTTTKNYTINRNGDYTITVKDHAGNETSIVKTIDNIKEFNPSITIENNGGTYVMPTDGGGATVKPVIKIEEATDISISYQFTNSATTQPTEYNKTIKGNRVELNTKLAATQKWYLWIKVTNSSGQVAYKVSEPFEVKNSSITLKATPDDWTKENVKVDITYGNGLTENQYAGIGENREAGLTTVTLSENGTVYAEATDKAGNKVYNSLNITKIDKVAPIITIDVKKKEYVLSSLEEAVEMTNKISVTEENLSDVKYTWVKEDKEPTTWDNSFTATQISAKSADVTKTATKEDIGTWYLYVKATDKAGNTMITKTEELIVKPAISFEDIEKIGNLKVINGVTYAILPEGIKVNDLLKYVVSPYNVMIKTMDGKEVSRDSVIATNQMVTIEGIDAQCILVVKGDVTGDGAVNMSDILKLNQYRLKKIELTMAEMLAGNVVDSDDTIDMRDILKINQYRLKKINQL